MPKIGHVHLKVSDIKSSEEFYIKIFGLKVSERIGDFIFLTFGKEHHDLALQEHKNAGHPSENMTGLYHFAVELENLRQLADVYFRLKKFGIKCAPIDHGISKAIYFSDPDNNGIEVYADTRDIRKKWEGSSSFIEKKDFDKWLNLK